MRFPSSSGVMEPHILPAAARLDTCFLRMGQGEGLTSRLGDMLWGQNTKATRRGSPCLKLRPSSVLVYCAVFMCIVKSLNQGRILLLTSPTQGRMGSLRSTEKLRRHRVCVYFEPLDADIVALRETEEEATKESDTLDLPQYHLRVLGSYMPREKKVTPGTTIFCKKSSRCRRCTAWASTWTPRGHIVAAGFPSREILVPDGRVR